MTEQIANKSAVVPVSPAELLNLRDAMSRRYGSYLRPGESLTIHAERTAEHAHAVFELRASDDSDRVEVECASLCHDHPNPAEWNASEALDLVLDLLDAELENFFEEERVPRFHDDWRPYELEGANLRLRGLRTRPNLEALADAWLASDGDPTAHGGDN